MSDTLSIYPTALKAEEVLKRSPGDCQWDERIFTFPQLIDRLSRELGCAAMPLSLMGERLATEQALRAAGHTLSNGMTARPGLTFHFLGAIRQLKSGMVRPEDLLRSAAALAEPAAGRVRAIWAVFAEYEAILGRSQLADAHSLERSVLDALHEAESGGPQPRLLNGVRRLHVAEVYDFSLLQFMIISSLIRLIGDARVTIQARPYRVNSETFLDLTWNRFVAEPSIANQILPSFVRRDGRTGQLGFLLETLFTEETRRDPTRADGTIRIIRATTREAEVEEICRSIRRAVARQPEAVPLDRIAIVARDLSPYARILEMVFARYRLPLELHHGTPLIESAAVRAALDLLKIPLHGYRRDALDWALALPFLTPSMRSCRWLLNHCGYLDEQTRPLKICLDARIDILGEQAEAEQDPLRRQRLESILASTRSGAAILQNLTAALQTNDVEASISDHAARFVQLLNDLDFDPARDMRVGSATISWTSFLAMLDELSSAANAVTTGRVVGLEEFALIVESAARSVTVSAPASAVTGGGVRAFSVLDARGLDFDLVFIIGLNEKAFPKFYADDPLLPDETKIALARPLASAVRAGLGRFAPALIGPVLRTAGNRSSEEWFLFFLALSIPAREAVLSYSTTDDTGAAASRSPYLEEILRLLDGNVLEESTAQVPEMDFGQCYAEPEFIAYAARHGVLSALDGIAADGVLQSLRERIEIERRRETYLSLPTREANDGTPVPAKSALADRFNGRVVADERLRAMLLGDATGPVAWSHQWFDHLAACGFRFFMRRVLRVKDNEEEPDSAVSRLETGAIVHETVRELMSAGIDFSNREAALERVRPLLDQIGRRQRLIARDPDFFDLEWAKIEMTIAELIDFEVSRRAETSPATILTELEFPVSFKLTDDSALLAQGRTEIAVDGRIDRLELALDDRERIRKLEVFDYKTSRSVKTFEKLLDSQREFGKTSFQIVVYLMGALETFRDRFAPELEVRGGYLVLRHRDKYQSRLFSRSEFVTDSRAASNQSESAPIAGRMIALIADALAGRFDVDPLSCDSFCPYRRVCRYYKPGYIP